MSTVPRLYETFQPTGYSISLDLDRVGRRFYGIVTIRGNTTSSEQQEINLHAKDLKIIRCEIDGIAATYQLEGDILSLNRTIGKFTYDDMEIVIEYEGIITDPMHGLYPCYFEHEGVKKELLATQFESHHAREVFPCIDEPEAKAAFRLSLTTESDAIALSNMPIINESIGNGRTTTTFKDTPHMSPYLLAFVVGELHSVSTKTKSGVDVNVWATPVQSRDSLMFALDTAVRSIEFFDDYFGVPYPLPKADHVALPDFSSGAMENWGLITYREICLLADQNTSVSTRQYIATVIAHETSHQWFGNLVTMKWWDDLWLNESFATLMEYICVDALYPDWQIWITFATNETLSAMRRDYLPGVQPVKTTVNHPDEISTLFDPSIVYAKGARLLAMLHDYVGDDAFRSGLSDYFRQHAYRNTIGTDLWLALSAASGQDIAAFMTPWLEQPGLPVVHLSTTTLSQERFVLGGDNPTPDALWPIPLMASDPILPALFIQKEQSVEIGTYTAINRGGRGHFVSHYADQNLLASRIAAVADGSEKEPTNRLTLLHDTSLLARAGYSDAVSLFQLAQAYQHEINEPVWDIVALVVGDLKRFVDGDEAAEERYKVAVAMLVRPTYERLNWAPKRAESESDTKLRATVVGLLSYSDDEAVIAHGLKDFRATQTLSELPGETRSLIFGIVAKHGEPKDIERLINAHQATNSAELRTDIAAGLCATRDTALISRLLGFMTDESVVRLQDVDHWFVYLIRNRYAREAAWDWMVTHWDWIKQKFGSDKSYDNFVRYSASALSTSAWLEKFTNFFADKQSEPALTRAITLGTSDIQARVDWLERDQSKFLNYLKSSK